MAAHQQARHWTGALVPDQSEIGWWEFIDSRFGQGFTPAEILGGALTIREETAADGSNVVVWYAYFPSPVYVEEAHRAIWGNWKTWIYVCHNPVLVEAQIRPPYLSDRKLGYVWGHMFEDHCRETSKHNPHKNTEAWRHAANCLQTHEYLKPDDDANWTQMINEHRQRQGEILVPIDDEDVLPWKLANINTPPQ